MGAAISGSTSMEYVHLNIVLDSAPQINNDEEAKILQAGLMQALWSVSVVSRWLDVRFSRSFIWVPFYNVLMNISACRTSFCWPRSWSAPKRSFSPSCYLLFLLYLVSCLQIPTLIFFFLSGVTVWAFAFISLFCGGAQWAHRGRGSKSLCFHN